MPAVALLALAALAAVAWSRRPTTHPAARRAPLSASEHEQLMQAIDAASDYEALVYLANWAAYYGDTEAAAAATAKAQAIGPARA